jgi:hypothetical protein
MKAIDEGREIYDALPSYDAMFLDWRHSPKGMLAKVEVMKRIKEA